MMDKPEIVIGRAPTSDILLSKVKLTSLRHALVTRVLWYLFIGCRLGFLWLNIGYFFVLTVIGLPLGLVMLNRLPLVLTLRRN
jgi:uncharacterized membrane protein YccF (DUF307 family)